MAAVVGLLVFAAVGPVLAGMLADIIGAARHPATNAGETPLWHGPGALFGTIGLALTTGVVVVALAWPAAKWIAADSRAAVLLLAPAALPAYLAYAGWGQLRAPDTSTGVALRAAGEWLSRVLVGEGGEMHLLGLTIDGDGRWVIAESGRLLALIGMALWAWPIAAIPLSASMRAAGRSLVELPRLEPCGWWRRMTLDVRTHARAALVGVVLVALVVMGSAVPLHLAQIETVAITLWRALAETPADQRWRVWLAAWPSVVAAVGAAIAAAWWVARPRGPVMDDPPPARAASRVGAGMVWAASVLVPLVLFAVMLRRWGSMRGFLHDQGEAIAGSVMIAAWVGGIGVVIAAGVSVLVAGGHRRSVAVCAGVLALAAVLPGVLIGAASAAGWTWAESVLGRRLNVGAVAVVLGHAARFGLVPLLLGVALARSEPEALAWSRAIDGASGVRGWRRGCLPWQAAGLIGAGLITAALSFHEVESSTLLRPPGLANLPANILNNLHYSRNEELASAAILVIGSAAVVSVVGAGLIAWSARVWSGSYKGAQDAGNRRAAAAHR